MKSLLSIVVLLAASVSFAGWDGHESHEKYEKHHKHGNPHGQYEEQYEQEQYQQPVYQSYQSSGSTVAHCTVSLKGMPSNYGYAGYGHGGHRSSTIVKNYTVRLQQKQVGGNSYKNSRIGWIAKFSTDLTPSYVYDLVVTDNNVVALRTSRKSNCEVMDESSVKSCSDVVENWYKTLDCGEVHIACEVEKAVAQPKYQPVPSCGYNQGSCHQAPSYESPSIQSGY